MTHRGSRFAAGSGLGIGAWAVAVLLGLGRPAHPPELPTCADIIRDGLDGVRAQGSPGLTLHRLKGWNAQPLWIGTPVGAVSRAMDDESATPPEVFPGLMPGDSGCLYFKLIDAPTPFGRSLEATFQVNGAASPEPLKGALACLHLGTIHEDEPPRQVSPASHCPVGAEAIGYLAGPDGRSIRLDFKVVGDFTRSLAAAFRSAVPDLSESAATALATSYDVAGPWFPCSTTTCCRAF